MNETNNRPALSFTYLESLVADATTGKKSFDQIDTPVSIAIHSIRKKLCDSDGISAKAAIDGLVHVGLLQNDSPLEVSEVAFSQKKGNEEITIITISDET